MTGPLGNGKCVIEFFSVKLGVDILQFMFILRIVASAGWLLENIRWETKVK